MKALNEIIRTGREAAGMTQETAAQKIGINRVTLSRFENNRQVPSMETLDRIRKTYRLNANVEELLMAYSQAVRQDEDDNLETALLSAWRQGDVASIMRLVARHMSTA